MFAGGIWRQCSATTHFRRSTLFDIFDMPRPTLHC
ncbi:hypothetical protein GBAR_LOCUS14738, partial [Geodia barretti]